MSYKSRKRTRTIGKILFVLYVGFVVWFLIFSDWYGRSGVMQEYHYNLELFREIKRFWDYRDQLGIYAMITNLFGNVLIFAPFGFFLPMASRYRSFFSTLYASFGLSLCVEVFQFVTRVGSFDVDDLLLNTIGGIIGHILYVVCETVGRHNDNKKKKKQRGRK